MLSKYEKANVKLTVRFFVNLFSKLCLDLFCCDGRHFIFVLVNKPRIVAMVALQKRLTPSQRLLPISGRAIELWDVHKGEHSH